VKRLVGCTRLLSVEAAHRPLLSDHTVIKPMNTGRKNTSLTRREFVEACGWLAIGPALGQQLFAAASDANVASQPDSYPYRAAWSNPAVAAEIEAGIERHRKADAALQFVDANGRLVADIEVRVEQISHAFLFGANLFVLGQLKTPELNHRYETAFTKLFNQATLPFYWVDLELEEGKLRFDERSSYRWRRPPPDQLVAFGKKHGLVLKGHPLVYTGFDPKWAKDKKQDAPRLIRRRLEQLAARYAGDIPIWDGVNESSRGFWCWFDPALMGGDYVAWAFRQERELFPHNILTINDTSWFVQPDDLRKGKYYQQIEGLLKQDVPIDCIGFQFHLRKDMASFLAGEHHAANAGRLRQYYEQFAPLKRPTHVTEITIPSAGAVGSSPAAQAEVVRDLYRLWFSVPSMACITYWNLADGTAIGSEQHLNGGFLDANFEPKPAYRVLDDLINRQWHTRATGKTSAQGTFSFRGFCGKYRVEVNTASGRKTYEINVDRRAESPKRLVL
jgi:endo-1,4-beta-xylanase